MPSRNVIRADVGDSYYHVYARGASKQSVFLESADYSYFLHLIERYLSTEQAISKSGVVYPNFRQGLELLAFCLMSNHFHLLIYQREQGSLARFMKSLMTSYSRYFNLKYKRTGSLFESRYKASLISSDEYLLHVSRYIHLNPRSWRLYPYSSLIFYRRGNEPEWLQTQRVLNQHDSREGYYAFVADYEDHRLALESLKFELADQ